jgi:glyoxylase-like metal-dependent hydrolase (beta-lactamase superfamily II)
MGMERITDDLYRIEILGFVNVYLIKTADGAAVVDAGIGPDLVPLLRKHLGELGLSLDQLKHILITHCHFDHVGGLRALQDALPTVPTYAGARDTLVITGEKPLQYAPRAELRGLDWLMSFGLASQGVPCRVDVQLREGDTLDAVLPSLRVIELSGHSYGQVGFYQANRELLIAGDALANFPFVGLTLPLRAPSVDWPQAKASARKIAALKPKGVVVGHGAAIMHDTAAQLDKLVARL